MNLRMGSQVFRDVQIPLLWGDRAILQDRQNRISIIDLSGERARVEVLGDEPAPRVGFRPRIDGFVILHDDMELYAYNPREKTVSGLSLALPEVQISPTGTRIGDNWFSGNFVQGSAVGLAIRDGSITIGGQLPPNLARLELQQPT